MTERSLSITFEGPDINARGVPFDDLLTVFEHLQTAVRRMAEFRALRVNSPTNIRDLFREAGTLRLRGAKQGSLVAEIELAEPTKLVDLGVEALDDVIAGLERPFEQLPPAVAREVAAIPESLHPAVSNVRVRGGRQRRVACLTRDMRFAEPASLAPRPEPMTLTGRILEVDWNSRTAELHTLAGVIALTFTAAQDDLMYEHARRYVRIMGIGTVASTGRVSRLAVERVIATTDDSEFWRASPIDQVKTQGVAPFALPDDLALADDTDADDFLDAIFAS